MILLLKKKFRGGVGSVMGDIQVKSDKDLKISYIDPNKFYV